MTRDFYTALAVWVGCKKCNTPTPEDLVRYQKSPFIDLDKTNIHYYCIAYAKEENITQWYVLDENGQTSCEDKKNYTSSPFCATNTISRIEATAILLRRANLWNDTLNAQNTDTSMRISDVSSYWYGYAKKWIESKILEQKNDGSIGQDEKITRGEFALMAARILEYTQCQTRNTTNTMEWAIAIVDRNRASLWKTTFTQGEYFDLIPLTATGTWEYLWEAKNIANTQTLTGNTLVLPGSRFGLWGWIVTLDIIDPKNQKTVSKPSATLFVITDTEKQSTPSVLLSANPLVGILESQIAFTPTVTNIWPNPIYRWDFWDGSTGNANGNTTHIYNNAGIYTVVLTVTDKTTWNAGQSSVVIKISGDKDTDKDGVLDQDDFCPLVYGERDNRGCPRINNGNFGTIINTQYTQNPPWGGTDTDGDGVPDSEDFCIRVPGIRENRGCPSVSVISGIFPNICLAKKSETEWLMIGTPVCTQCPCSVSLNITSPLRSCDTLFPAILSPDGNTVYSRWWFFLVP